MKLTNLTAADFTNGKSNKPWESIGVSIDTRTLTRGNLFIALKGPNYNGHHFIKEAFNKGAKAVVINKNEVTEDLLQYPILIVEDTYKALIDLAKAARKLFKGKVVAVTGSVGKTSFKEMLNLVLSKVTSVYANKGNYNNNIGLPLSLVNLNLQAEVAIFELGMNKANEIAELSKIVSPHIAIITEVAIAHSDFFNNLQEIFLAKMEIVEGMESNSYLVFNYNNQFYNNALNIAEKYNLKLYGFGESLSNNIRGKDLFTTLVASSPNINFGGKLPILMQEVTCKINNSIYNYYLPTLGKHKALLSTIVLGVVSLLGYDIKQCANNFKYYKELAGRGKVEVLKLLERNLNFFIIDDSYNSSPLSMKKSILMLKDIKSDFRKILVLGDMLELKNEISEHKKLKDYILKIKPNAVFTLGPLMEHLVKELPQNITTQNYLNVNELLQKLISYLQNNDILLVKGSLGSNVHKIVKELKNTSKINGN